MRRSQSALLLVLAVAGSGCDKLAQLVAAAHQKSASPAPAGPGAVAPPVSVSGGLAEVQGMIASGRAEEALAKLQAMPQDADTLSYQGLAWAKKAETAPLPTPPPPPNPAVRGQAPPAAPEFKPEELTAIDFFEKALQQRADHPGASLGLAELLAPHAARHYDRQQQSTRGRKPLPRGAKPQVAEPPTDTTGAPDFSIARVAQLYQSALQGTAQTEPAQSYVKFCMRVGLLDEADAALRELVRRDKEKPEPLVRYGDFLVEVRKDPQGALEQYRQALIWSPDDTPTKSKIADIYINLGIESYSKLQYASAEARFNDALKYVTDPKSPQGLKIQDYMGKLGQIRKLPTH